MGIEKQNGIQVARAMRHWVSSLGEKSTQSPIVGKGEVAEFEAGS
jgi:hypothetical protein